DRRERSPTRRCARPRARRVLDRPRVRAGAADRRRLHRPRQVRELDEGRLLGKRSSVGARNQPRHPAALGQGGSDPGPARQRQPPRRAAVRDRGAPQRRLRHARLGSQPLPRDRDGREGGGTDRAGRDGRQRAGSPGRRRHARRRRGAATAARHADDGPRQVDQRPDPEMTTPVRIAVLLLLLVAPAAQARTQAGLTVYAAASLTDVFPKIDSAPRYSFSGSNTLAAQIQQGAPADVFASANMTLPRQLNAKGLCSRPVVFTRNTLVIVVPKSNPAAIHSVYDLARSGVKVDIAGPGVPVGSYTLQI